MLNTVYYLVLLNMTDQSTVKQYILAICNFDFICSVKNCPNLPASLNSHPNRYFTEQLREVPLFKPTMYFVSLNYEAFRF